MLRLRLLFFLLVIAVLNSYAQINTFHLPEKKKREIKSFENYDNLVIIEVLLQDSLPVKLILDSGIEGLIITDPGLVEAFAPFCLRTFKLTAPGNAISLNACVTPAIKVDFGGLEPMFTNMILLQEDMFSLDAFIGAKVHGLIGIDKFRNLAITINYFRNQLKITRPEDIRINSKSEIIPLNILRGRPFMTARVELDTKEIRDLWLMIDSGANHPLLIETDSTDSYQPVYSLKTTIGRGLGGNIDGEFVRSGWLMLGNYRLDNIITSVSAEYFTGSPSLRNYRNGTLGAGALSRFNVTFDYTNSRLILEKGPKFKRPFEYNMSGIVFESVSQNFNLFKVSEVISNSPAQEAGVLPGDLLVAINEKSAFSITLGELNGMLNRNPGSTVSLIMNREGKPLNFKFRLKRLI